MNLIPTHPALLLLVFCWLFLNFCFLCCRPSSDFKVFNANEPAMWVKISSSWVCLVLYAWTLIAPLVLRDRIFD